MTARARWLIARTARRHRIDVTFKRSGARADKMPKPVHVVGAVFRGAP